MKEFDVIIVGGGAAGFFAAINIAEMNPSAKIAILERGKTGLQKVKISGGGRCNVTHAEFIPSELVLNYPRGEKELLGPFHHFMTGDTISWFEQRGIELKVEEDGRMFPVSNTSQTIIDCFLSEAKKHNIQIFYGCSLKDLSQANNQWVLKTTAEKLNASKVVMATGSNPKVWSILEALGHTIVAPVPSLFTFDIKDERIKNIPGLVVKDVEVNVVGTKLQSFGPLLITHVGMSAPAILKLSAFGAIELAACNYNFDIEINFIRKSPKRVISEIKVLKMDLAKKSVSKYHQFDIPKRLWRKLVHAAPISEDKKWADLNKLEMDNLASQLTKARFQVTGKSTFKEEFVTAGGVELSEINFRTFESKKFKNLYFAGEILNVDAVTGGFNFQSAWSSAYILASNLNLFSGNQNS
ncbi:MAG: NAD(P)/FAD-dependent oxidoreductase [Bacteroidota bacterium]